MFLLNGLKNGPASKQKMCKGPMLFYLLLKDPSGKPKNKKGKIKKKIEKKKDRIVKITTR
jgi:hypothetical protein